MDMSLGIKNLFEGNFSQQFQSKHDHTSDPEEQDIMAGLQQTSGIKYLKIIRLQSSLSR